VTDRECLGRCLRDHHREDLSSEGDSLLAAKAAAMAVRIAAGIPLCPGVRSFLAEASAVGPLGVVSGALADEVDRVLRQAGVRELFATIVAAEDVRRGKPDPEGYRLGWRRLRASLPDLELGDCLAVEDAPAGIRAAHAAGLPVLAVATTRPQSALGDAELVVPSLADVDWNALRSEQTFTRARS
jgi:HAD superfamily hydrolase (TIGR01509 family)